jgi:GH24 family phage-related lysozyme (muramidase)
MNEQLRLSERGARFIADFEGCVLHPYNDPWNATIGIGHLIHYGRVTSADIRRYQHFTYQDAIELLRLDVRHVEQRTRALIRTQLNQNQWDALISLVFNCGPLILRGTVGLLINRREFWGAADAWQAWDHGNGGILLPGLQRRRQAERKLFLEPIAPNPPTPPYVPPDEHNWIREYDRLTREHRAPWRQAWLRRTMRQREKVITMLAHQTGWNRLNRTNRYHELARRTRS